MFVNLGTSTWNYFNIQEPVTVELGTMYRYKWSGAKHSLVEKSETFQYVPLMRIIGNCKRSAFQFMTGVSCLNLLWGWNLFMIKHSDACRTGCTWSIMVIWHTLRIRSTCTGMLLWLWVHKSRWVGDCDILTTCIDKRNILGWSTDCKYRISGQTLKHTTRNSFLHFYWLSLRFGTPFCRVADFLPKSPGSDCLISCEMLQVADLPALFFAHTRYAPRTFKSSAAARQWGQTFGVLQCNEHWHSRQISGLVLLGESERIRTSCIEYLLTSIR